GFGTYNKNFWLGLDKMHRLTTSADYRLKFEVLISGKWYSDEYDHFKVGPESEKYTLNVSGYGGDKCDALNNSYSYLTQNGMKFSTPDQDNDLHPTFHCAFNYSSGNWYNSCFCQRLNGVYGSSFDYAFFPVTHCRMMVKCNL
ncbi:hypothetical protein HELRODRAFT_81692, partial [Helobdella robusta]|uniref:Fibrinogen C-terminal domain-containing protein n=1 Tax=Helobdella robusta TaxID=6412 RepID=T1G4H7_HELRO